MSFVKIIYYGFIFSLLNVSSESLSLNTPSVHFGQKEKIVLTVFVAAVVGFVLKKACNYYYDYVWSHSKAIAYSQRVYKQTVRAIRKIDYLYRTDISLDQDELEKHIFLQNPDNYPFIKYYKKLTNFLFVLDDYSQVIKSELRRIEKRQELLAHDNDNIVDKDTLLTLFKQLEDQGNALLIDITEFRKELTELRNRVVLLNEYQDELIEWEEEERLKQELQERQEY